LAAVADRLVAEAGERGRRGGELPEPALRARRPGAGAERLEDAAQDLPRGQRLAERLDGLAEPLDASLEVRVRPLALDPGRGRQDPVGALTRGVRVRADPDEGLGRAERAQDEGLRPGARQEVV